VVQLFFTEKLRERFGPLDGATVELLELE